MLREIIRREVPWTRRGVLAGKDTIYSVPGQKGTVATIRDVVHTACLGKFSVHTVLIRGAGQAPRIRIQQIHTALGGFKVIQVGISSRVFILIVTCHQISEFCIERDLTRFRKGEQGQFIEHIRQPLAFRLVRGIQTPQGVLDRLLAHSGLHGHRHLRHVHHRRSQRKVFRELIVQIQAHHRLSLHVER